jgi:hypothetical protein
MTLALHQVLPNHGPTSGGNLVRLVGDAFTQRLSVRLGALPPLVTRAFAHHGAFVADLLVPPHPAGAVDVAITTLDAVGVPLPDVVVAPRAYTFDAPDLLGDADLTRICRAVVQLLRRDLLVNTHLAVHVDVDPAILDAADPTGPLRVTPIATVPSVVVSGPALRPSGPYRSTAPAVARVDAETVFALRPATIVDLAFTLTGASRSVAELLNLFAVTRRCLARTPWLVMPRDPDDATAGTVRWDLDPDGDWRTQLPGADGVHSFTGGLIVRGVALDDGLATDLVPLAASVQLATAPLAFTPGVAP